MRLTKLDTIVTVTQFCNIGLTKWIGSAEEEKQDAGARLSGKEEEATSLLISKHLLIR